MSNLASIIKVEPGFLVSPGSNEEIVKVINEQERFTC